MQESEEVEFKKSTGELKEAVISLVAILNKHGKGTLYFGVSNTGIAVGQEVTEATLREVSQALSQHVEPRIYPEIQTQILSGKSCVKVTFEGHDQPYFAYGRPYMRVADEDKQVSAKELEHFFAKKNKEKIAWDTHVWKNALFSDIDKKKIKNFLTLAGQRFDTIENTLKKLGLLKETKLTNAAVLLFGKKPRTFFLNAKLRCATFATETTQPIDMQDFEDDLFSLIDRAEKYVLQNIHVGMKIEGLLRVDVPEISKDAFREAIINAFCHRDYWSLASIDVAIFKNRLEIRSPGLLIGGLTIKQLRKENISERRNELIAKILKEAHFVESWGTGIHKMIALEPRMTMEEVGTHFVTTFPRKEASTLTGREPPQKTPQKTPQKPTMLEEKILALISKNSTITREELALQLKLSPETVKEYLAKLKEKGLLKRIGPDKGGSWEIVR